MHITRILPIYFVFGSCVAFAQQYSSANIFSHNDYAQKNPFTNAYDLQVGYIEADVFLQNGELLVGHETAELKKDRTLETLYLVPIQEKMALNKGTVYSDPSKTLTLMIDLKTEGISTLNSIVKTMSNYPDLISCKTLIISISGNVPDRLQWKNFPDYIYFDGRPGIDYTTGELQRISFISTSFDAYSSWKGADHLPESERQKLLRLRDEVHAKDKKLRFWGAPDLPQAWKLWMEMGIDILGTDNVIALEEFIKR
jgi:alkaline phosphatase